MTYCFLNSVDYGIMLYSQLFQADLFQVPGLQSEVQQIRDCLDTGVPEQLRILVLPCLVGPSS